VPRPPGARTTAEIAASEASAARDNAEAVQTSFGMVESALMAAAHVAAIYVLYRGWRSFRFVEQTRQNDEDWWNSALAIASPVLSMLGSLIKNGGDVQKAIADIFGALHRAVMSMVLAVLAPFITRRQQADGSILNTIEPHNAALLALLMYGFVVMALKSGLVSAAVNGGLQMIGDAIPL